jgi:cell division protein FtsB
MPNFPSVTTVLPSWRRRRYLVEGFQARFVFTHVVWLTVFLALFGLVLFAPHIRGLYSDDPGVRMVAADHFILMHEVFWPALLLVLVVATAVTVRLSHRIAGPLYRFRQTFAAVEQGRLDVSARIRSGDYLTAESAAIEAMLAALRTRFDGAHAMLAIAEARLALDSRPGCEVLALVSSARKTLEGNPRSSGPPVA